MGACQRHACCLLQEAWGINGHSLQTHGRGLEAGRRLGVHPAPCRRPVGTHLAEDLSLPTMISPTNGLKTTSLKRTLKKAAPSFG